MEVVRAIENRTFEAKFGSSTSDTGFRIMYGNIMSAPFQYLSDYRRHLAVADWLHAYARQQLLGKEPQTTVTPAPVQTVERKPVITPITPHGDKKKMVLEKLPGILKVGEPMTVAEIAAKLDMQITNPHIYSILMNMKGIRAKTADRNGRKVTAFEPVAITE